MAGGWVGGGFEELELRLALQLGFGLGLGKNKNNKNSGLPKLLRWTHALRSDQKLHKFSYRSESSKY